MAFVAVVATASTNVQTDCSTEEVGVDAVTTSLLQVGNVEKQKGSTRQAKADASELFNSPNATRGVDLLEEEQQLEGGDNKKDKVVFIKLHKVGSTTVADILRRRCDNYGFRCAGVPKLHIYVTTVKSEGLKGMVSEHAGEYDIWANHVVLDPEALDALIPGNIKTAVFRNPLDRVLSSFRHAAKLFGPAAATSPIHTMQQDRWPMELCFMPDMWYHNPSQCCGPVGGCGDVRADPSGALRQA